MKEEKETKAKTTASKTASKKPAAKKTTVSKKATETKKTAAKKTTTTKKAAEKKPVAKKATTKRPTVKKEVKKAEEKPTVEQETKSVPLVDEVKEVVNSIDKEKIKTNSKNIIDIVLSVYAKPYETCKEETENREIKNSMILLVLIALSLGFMVSALTYASFHLNVGQFGSVSDYYDVPYFKIFIVWSVISFIMSFLPIVLSHLAGTIFSKNKFSFSGLVNLYASSLSVVILINVISATFIFAGLFVKFFLLISILTLLFGVINYIFVYRDLMDFDKKKETYIFLGMILVWILGLVIIASLFASGVDGLNALDTINTTINN